MFNSTLKKYADVLEAYQVVRQSQKELSNDHARKYEALTRAALYAVWLALHDNERRDILTHANDAIALSTQAVLLNNVRVEGFYYRAIATGLFAEQNKAYGRSAMNEIRSDGERAIELDPKFDHAGPHRLLGAFYLRAPGPPAGFGSVRKATAHLEKACTISPAYPENLIFLAEAYLKSNRYEEAGLLLDRAHSLVGTEGNLLDQQKWQEQLNQLKMKIE
ncbi:MAG TPA: TRAP transporter TatT component family protein [bacterium]